MLALHLSGGPMSNSTIALEARFQKRDLKLACAFADDNEDTFDGEFVHSLQSKFNSFGYLTDKQYSALQNTIERWNMESWAAKEGLDFEVEPANPYFKKGEDNGKDKNEPNKV